MIKVIADVAVVAAGPAGLTAAIAAAENGAEVVVFEKGNTTGGTANMAMGPFAVESSIQKKMMCNLTKEEAFKKYMEAMEWNVDAKIVHDYFWRSGETIDWLMDMGVQFATVIKNFPNSEQTWHVVQPEGGGHIGTRCAAAMFKVMHKKALELGVKFYLSTPVSDLKKEGDKVCGFYAKSESGEEYDVDSKAIIIATGGFGSNPEMIAKETGYTFGKDMFTFMIPGIVGEGIKMAWKAGVGKGRIMMEKIIGHPMQTALSGETIQFLNFVQGSPIAVNMEGKRICDESVMQNMSIGANIIDYQNARTVYKILDDKMIRYFKKKGQEFPNEVFAGDPTENFDAVWSESEKMFPDCAMTGESIKELANKMGLPVDNLQETIENYNKMCSNNYDEEFGKPRQFLHAIDGKKYYAYRLSIGAYGSLGGIKINSNYETVSDTGMVISGLYAAGTDVCEIYNGTYYYNFPGNSLGFAINSGRIAGENAADYVLGE